MIQEDGKHSGLRPVDIGMTLDTNGAFQVSIFDSNDPDHIRKRKFYQKTQASPEEGNLVLDYVVQAATTDWKEEGMTAEEFRLIVTASLLFVFYLLVKLLISKEDILRELPGRLLDIQQCHPPLDLSTTLKLQTPPKGESLGTYAKNSTKVRRGKKPTLIVVYLGGITYMEIAALRFLSKRDTFPYHIIMVTTRVMNGSTLLKSLE